MKKFRDEVVFVLLYVALIATAVVGALHPGLPSNVAMAWAVGSYLVWRYHHDGRPPRT